MVKDFKPYSDWMTRDGRLATIVPRITPPKPPYTLTGVVWETQGGNPVACSWTMRGRAMDDWITHHLDLVCPVIMPDN